MQAILEGLLFMAGEEGLSLVQIQSVFPDHSREDLEKQLQVLGDMLNHGHGVELVQFGGRYKIVTREQIFPYAKKLYEEIKAPSLSNAALETLAIIAYKQPITRVEIEEIRGVSCDAILKKLQMRDLIAADSRSDAVGKPLLYTVTDTFMDSFALTSLDELPKLENTRQNLFDSDAEKLS